MQNMLIPGTGPTNIYPSWWIQQSTSNPVDPEYEVIHDLQRQGSDLRQGRVSCLDGK